MTTTNFDRDDSAHRAESGRSNAPFDRADTRTQVSADIEERYPFGPPVQYFDDD